jgi:uncharacterized protein (DUF885 family)
MFDSKRQIAPFAVSEAGTATPKNPGHHMDDFATAAKRIIDDYLKHAPIAATMAGLHDYDAELPDLSPDGFAGSLVRDKAYLATVERYAADELSPSDRIDHALLKARFETDVREHEAREPHRHDPTIYPENATVAVYSLLMHDFAPIQDRVPALEARLGGIPDLLAAGRANLTTSPAIWTEIAVDETEGGVEFLKADVAPLCERFPQLAKPLERAIAAFEEYLTFLKGTLAQRNGVPFSLGRDLFDFRLRREHLLPYDSDSLRAFGQDAIRRTIASLVETAKRVHPSKEWAELIHELRTDHPDERSLIAEYRRGVEEARNFIVERNLATMPIDDHLDVVETPPFMRPTVPYAAYMPPGPFESRQRGLYYVTPVDPNAPAAERAERLLGHNRPAMLLTTVHEAYPGHHLQLVKANESGTTVRKLLESTVLIEGWALYCEQLVLDEGMSDDPRIRLFQLKDQLWRACRVVIDVELHTGQMTFDEAVAMLVDVAHLERPNAVGEVRRYTNSPTQPMSYLAGKQQIMELRERERTRLGGSFDLRAFHDRLLSFGSIPIALIEPEFSRVL